MLFARLWDPGLALLACATLPTIHPQPLSLPHQVRIAVHHLSQRKVAIKIIDKAKLTDPNEAKRMQREIRVMKHLTHECIIKLFEVGGKFEQAASLQLTAQYDALVVLVDEIVLTCMVA